MSTQETPRGSHFSASPLAPEMSTLFVMRVPIGFRCQGLFRSHLIHSLDSEPAQAPLNHMFYHHAHSALHILQVPSHECSISSFT